MGRSGGGEQIILGLKVVKASGKGRRIILGQEDWRGAEQSKNRGA